MKNTKRFLAVLLVLVMVLSCLPMTALAAEKTGRSNSKPAKRGEDDEVITATWAQMPEDGDAVVLYSAKDGAIMAYSAESADDGEYITAWNQNTEPATVEGTKLTAAWYDAGILYALDMGDGIWAFIDEYEYDYNDAMYCLYNDGSYVGTIGDPETDGTFCYYQLELTTNGCLFMNVGSGLYLTIGSDGLFYDTENASEATPLAFYVVDGGEEPVDPTEPIETDPIDPADDEVITATWAQMPEDGDAVVLYSAKDGAIMAYSAESADDGEYITAWNQNTEPATVEGTKLTAAWDDAGILYALDMGDGTWAFIDEYEYDYNDAMYCLYNDGTFVGTIGDPDYDEEVYLCYELELTTSGYLFKNVGSGLYLTIGSDGLFYDTADASKATPLAFYVVGGEEPVDPTEPIETDPIETEPIETDPIETDPVETDPIETEPIETDPIETDPIETDPVETDPIETDPIETEPVDPEDDEVITATWAQMPESGDCVVLYSAKDGVIMAYSADTDEETYWNQNTEAATVEGTKLTASYSDAGTLYALDCGDGIWAFIDEYYYNYFGEEYCLLNDGTLVGTIGNLQTDGEYCYYELEMTTSGCLFKNVGSGLYLTIKDGVFYDTENASEATPLAFYVVEDIDPIDPIDPDDPGDDEVITAAWTQLPEDGDPVVLYSAKDGAIMAWSFAGEEDDEGYYISWNQCTEAATVEGYKLTAAYDDAGIFYALDMGDGIWAFMDEFYYDYLEYESYLYNDGAFVGVCGDAEYDEVEYLCYELEAAANGYLFKNVGSGLYLTIGSDGLFYDTADASKATPLAFYVVGGEEPVDPTDPTEPIETEPIETEPIETKDPCEGYTDIDRSAWYHDAADFVIARGIMSSTKTDSLVFEPYTVCTRAMIATMLYSLEGKPEVEYEAAFPDVKDDQWFTDAVMWAYKSGVVSGYDNGSFGPNDKVTREQMAVILKAYAEQVKDIDTSKTADLTVFPDYAKVKWSEPYITWAVAEGLISGKEQNGVKYLDPQGNATRAEVAAIMRSFITNIIEAAK